MTGLQDDRSQRGGLPPALPPGAPSNGPFPPVNAPEDPIAGGKVGHPVIHSQVPVRTGAARTPGTRRTTGRGPGTVGLRDLLTQLSQRDCLVLTLIRDHKFLTTRQLQALAFTQHASALSAARTTRRVIQRLSRDGLLVSLPRRVGGMYGGAENPIWHLTPTGYRLVHLAAGNADGGLPLRIREPSKRTIEHCHAVAETRITAEQTARQTGDGSSVRVVTEPETWRRYTGPMGTTENLKPDLEIVTRTTDDHGEYEDRWFFEVDLDTEHPPVVVRQCQQYEGYRRTGLEQERNGVFPIVVWVVPHDKRAGELGKAIRATQRLDTRLFRVITGEQVEALIRTGQGGEV